MIDPLPFSLPIAGVFLLAGMVKGVVGLGLPTVAMGLLGLPMPPVEAAALLLVPSLVTNVWQLLAGPRFGALLRRLRPHDARRRRRHPRRFGADRRRGSPRAPRRRPWRGPGASTAAVGLAKPACACRPRRKAGPGRWSGAATGLVTGATGVFVIPAVPYLGALGLERDDLVQALGLSFTVSTLALAAGLACTARCRSRRRACRCSRSCPALAGMALGGWLRARLRPEAFRLCFFLGLLALGAELVWRGLG